MEKYEFKSESEAKAEEKLGNRNYDALFEELEKVMVHIRKTHTTADLSDVYEKIVEHNKVAEKEFLERLAKRKEERLKEGKGVGKDGKAL
jgi:hypothetical protein